MSAGGQPLLLCYADPRPSVSPETVKEGQLPGALKEQSFLLVLQHGTGPVLRRVLPSDLAHCTAKTGPPCGCVSALLRSPKAKRGVCSIVLEISTPSPKAMHSTRKLTSIFLIRWTASSSERWLCPAAHSSWKAAAPTWACFLFKKKKTKPLWYGCLAACGHVLMLRGRIAWCDRSGRLATFLPTPSWLPDVSTHTLGFLLLPH